MEQPKQPHELELGEDALSEELNFVRSFGALSPKDQQQVLAVLDSLLQTQQASA